MELESEREKLDLNMTEFAKRLKISQSLYSMFVRKARPRLGLEAMRAVCDYFGVQPDHWDMPPEPLREPCVIKLETALKDPGIQRKRGDLITAIENLVDILYSAVPKRVGKALEPENNKE
jgi:transcriptional regulator with XRE-family HTH domain